MAEQFQRVRITDPNHPHYPLMATGTAEKATAKMSRVWAMPNHNTFDIKPIGDLVRRHLAGAAISVDPFSRDKKWATFTNDLNPATSAEYHMDATDFLTMLGDQGVSANLVILDPPYSPRQVKECYDSIGLKMQQGDALLGAIRKKRNAAVDRLVPPGGVVITCGWNTVGMGKTLGYVQEEILLVCHGSDHNDTIVLVERKFSRGQVAILPEPSR